MKNLKYYPFFYLVVGFMLTCMACNKQIDFGHTDRINIQKDFKLIAVKNQNNELIRQFHYDNQGRLKEILWNGADRFLLSYDLANGRLQSFNNYTCTYDDKNLLISVEGPELRKVIIKYFADYVQVIQHSRPIVPSPQPNRIDTLNLYYNANREIIRATLFPKKLTYEFRYDQNIIPYVNIQQQLLPVLMVYPLQDVYLELASLISNKNILRAYQSGLGISNAIEKPTVIDFTYRLDHIDFDIPTSSKSYGSLLQDFRYEYNK